MRIWRPSVLKLEIRSQRTSNGAMLHRLLARALAQDSQKSGEAPDKSRKNRAAAQIRFACFWRFELLTGGAGLETCHSFPIGRAPYSHRQLDVSCIHPNLRVCEFKLSQWKRSDSDAILNLCSRFPVSSLARKRNVGNSDRPEAARRAGEGVPGADGPR
jgi:hypothetical protein